MPTETVLSQGNQYKNYFYDSRGAHQNPVYLRISESKCRDVKSRGSKQGFCNVPNWRNELSYQNKWSPNALESHQRESTETFNSGRTLRALEQEKTTMYNGHGNYNYHQNVVNEMPVIKRYYSMNNQHPSKIIDNDSSQELTPSQISDRYRSSNNSNPNQEWRRKNLYECPRTLSVQQQRQQQNNENPITNLSGNIVIPKCMNDEELARFRTQICPNKVAGKCFLEERCSYSHCLSFHRRPPHVTGYRPNLCPNVVFTIGSNRKMRVKNYCRRGRLCLFAHTKEEQMYHPKIYKTMQCRDWPGCDKQFCPFAHGPDELRNPDLIEFNLVAGPEKPEPETMMRKQWANNSSEYGNKTQHSPLTCEDENDRRTLPDRNHHNRWTIAADVKAQYQRQNSNEWVIKHAESLPLVFDNDSQQHRGPDKVKINSPQDKFQDSLSTVSPFSTMDTNQIPMTVMNNARRIHAGQDTSLIQKDKIIRDDKQPMNDIYPSKECQMMMGMESNRQTSESCERSDITDILHNEVKQQSADYKKQQPVILKSNSFCSIQDVNVKQLTPTRSLDNEWINQQKTDPTVDYNPPDIRDIIIFEMLMNTNGCTPKKQDYTGRSASTDYTSPSDADSLIDSVRNNELQNIIDQLQAIQKQKNESEDYNDVNGYNGYLYNVDNLIQPIDTSNQKFQDTYNDYYYDDPVIAIPPFPLHGTSNDLFEYTPTIERQFSELMDDDTPRIQDVDNVKTGTKIFDIKDPIQDEFCWSRLLASMSSMTLVTDCS